VLVYQAMRSEVLLQHDQAGADAVIGLFFGLVIVLVCEAMRMKGLTQQDQIEAAASPPYPFRLRNAASPVRRGCVFGCTPSMGFISHAFSALDDPLRHDDICTHAL